MQFSDRQPQISNKKDYECSNVLNFVPKFPTDGAFNPKSCILDINFKKKTFSAAQNLGENAPPNHKIKQSAVRKFGSKPHQTKHATKNCGQTVSAMLPPGEYK